MWLRVLVRIGGEFQLGCLRVNERVSLGWPLYTVSPMQAGVEPLGAVRCGSLTRNHITHLIEVRAGISLAGEVSVLPAPVGPGPCEPPEELSSVGLPTHSLISLNCLKLLMVRLTSL